MGRGDPPTDHRGIVKKCQKSRRSLIDALAFHWGGTVCEFKIQIGIQESRCSFLGNIMRIPGCPCSVGMV